MTDSLKTSAQRNKTKNKTVLKLFQHCFETVSFQFRFVLPTVSDETGHERLNAADPSLCGGRAGRAHRRGNDDDGDAPHNGQTEHTGDAVSERITGCKAKDAKGGTA